MRNTNYL